MRPRCHEERSRVKRRHIMGQRMGPVGGKHDLAALALFILDRMGVIRFSQVYSDPLNPGVGGILTTLEALAAADDLAGEG